LRNLIRYLYISTIGTCAPFFLSFFLLKDDPAGTRERPQNWGGKAVQNRRSSANARAAKKEPPAGSKDSAAVSVRKVLPPMPGKEADGEEASLDRRFTGSAHCPDDAAGQPFSRVAGRLGAIIVGIFVDNDGFADNVADPEPVRKETHAGIAVIGKKDGKIPRVIAMGLIVRVPMAARPLKRIVRVADGAISMIMDMKSVGPYRRASAGSGTVGGKPGNFHKDFRAASEIGKKANAPEIRRQRSAFDDGIGRPAGGSLRGIRGINIVRN